MIHSGHKDLSDRWGDRYAPVVFRAGGVSFPLVEGDDLSCAPRLWGSRRDCTGIKKAC
jgi:hypothetical protein